MPGHTHICGYAPFCLSRRQRQTLQLAAQGLTDKAISWRLGIAPRTVRAHLERARLALGAINTTQAVAAALTAGLIEYSRPGGQMPSCCQAPRIMDPDGNEIEAVGAGLAILPYGDGFRLHWHLGERFWPAAEDEEIYPCRRAALQSALQLSEQKWAFCECE